MHRSRPSPCTRGALLLAALAILAAPGARAFVHPGVPFSADDLAQLKVNVESAPWSTGYRQFLDDPHSSLAYEMRGPKAAVSRVPMLNRNEWMSDMQAAHNLAFRWVFTGDAAYARKATAILDAWAVTNRSFTGDEAVLDLGDWVHCYATSADILKSTFPGWTAANTAHVKNYFANVLWPALDVPNPVRGANQGALALRAAVGIAAFLDDETKWKQAIESLRHDPAGGLANTLPNGEVGDSGRDEGHTAGQIGGLAWAAEVAWKQGIDIFADGNNRLLTAGELYARYNLDPAGIAYIPFGNPYELYPAGFGWKKGTLRPAPLYNLIEGAYAVRKGIPAPFIVKHRARIPETKDTFLFRKIADKSTATPLPPLLHPPVVPVTRLDQIDIGTVGLAGSADFRNGTWTVTGAGDIPVPAQALPAGPATTDAFHFAYRQITGDAVMIARVTAVGSTHPEAKAGLMLRESLDADARHVAIFLSPGVGARTTWRGATAWTKTDTSWLLRAPGGYEQHAAAKPPYWLKLDRLGTRVAVYNSFDGVSWTCQENVETPIARTAYLGLAVSSRDPKVLNPSTFTHVNATF